MTNKTVYATYKTLGKPKISLPKFGGKKLKIVLVILLVLTVLFGTFFGFFVGLPLLKAKSYANELKISARAVKDAFSERDLGLAEQRMVELNTKLLEFETFYNSKLKMASVLPFTKTYYVDGIHFIKAGKIGLDLATQTLVIMEPFSLELGFKKDGDISEIDNKTRIFKLIEILPSVSGELSTIFSKVSEIDKELSFVDETKYPEEFRGMQVRKSIGQAKTLSHEFAVKAPSFDKMLKVLPDLLGLKEPKTYMVFMANNYELRMSGGFHTYLVLVKIDKGVPEIVTSIDTYDIDRDKSYLVYRNVPYHLRDYLLVNRLYARDATSDSPDFKIAADSFLAKFWRADPVMPQKFDGVIQVNNFVVENFLKVVGPVQAGGYSVKTDQDTYITVPVQEYTSENVTLELEKIAGGALAETIGRKDIIKILMLSIIDKALNTPAENLGALIEEVFREFNEKNILIYSFNEDAEKAMEELGYGGRIVNVPTGYDYLHVNSSNYGAGKRNWLVKRTVTKENVIEDGKKVSIVKIKTVNPKSPEWWQWMPFYREYFRVYAPLGSKLISAESSDGQQINGKEIEDLGKTAFEGFFKLEEDKETTITVKYYLSENVNFDDYKLIVQKQSGTWGDPYSISHKGSTQNFDLRTDKEVTF